MEICRGCHHYNVSQLTEMGFCNKRKISLHEMTIMDIQKEEKEKEMVDLDTHLKILNFLIHLQSFGVITEAQRLDYSNYIQDYLTEKKNNLDFMENLLNEMLSKDITD